MSEKNEKTEEKTVQPIPQQPATPKVAELSDKALEQVSGGTMHQDIAVNKQKTADKAAAAVDGFIRG